MRIYSAGGGGGGGGEEEGEGQCSFNVLAGHSHLLPPLFNSNLICSGGMVCTRNDKGSS